MHSKKESGNPLSLNNYYLDPTKATISRDFHRFFLIVNSCYKQSFIFILYLHIYQLMDTHFCLIWYRLSQWTPISLSVLRVYQINSDLSIYFKIILQFHMNLYCYYYHHIFLVLIYSTYYALQISY